MQINRRNLMGWDRAEYLYLAWSINPNKTKQLIAQQVPNIEVTAVNLNQIADLDYFNFSRFLRQFKTNTDELIRAHAKGRIKVIWNEI